MMKYIKSLIILCFLATNYLHAMDSAYGKELVQKIEGWKSTFDIWKKLTKEERFLMQKTLDDSLFYKSDANCKAFVTKYKTLFPASFINNDHLEMLNMKLVNCKKSDWFIINIVLILIIDGKTSDFVSLVQTTYTDQSEVSTIVASLEFFYKLVVKLNANNVPKLKNPFALEMQRDFF